MNNCRHQCYYICKEASKIWFYSVNKFYTWVVFFVLQSIQIFPGTNCALWKMFPILLDFFFFWTIRLPAGPAGLCRCQSLQEECLQEKGHRNGNHNLS